MSSRSPANAGASATQPANAPAMSPARRPDDVERELAGPEAERVLGGPIDAFERLTHSMITRGVWRVRAAGATAILKILARPGEHAYDPGWEPDSRPESMRYWLREAYAYDPTAPGGGIPEPYLHAGIRGPLFLGRFDRPEGDVALWLEDVRGESAGSWDLAAFEEFAERLGRAHGSYLARGGVPVSDSPAGSWLSRGFLREYLASPRLKSYRHLLDSDDAWSHPMIASHFDADLRAGVVAMARDRDRLLVWHDAVPEVVAHLDLWPANIFAPAGSGEPMVLIDWSFAGVGAAGEDLGNLVPDSVFDMLHPPESLEPLDRALWSGYRRGVRAAGWTGDERWLRLGICASAVKYDWIAAGTLARAAEGGDRQAIYAGQTVEAARLFAVRAAVLRFLVRWADEARTLAAGLGLG